MRGWALVICGIILLAAFAITVMSGANAGEHRNRVAAPQAVAPALK